MVARKLEGREGWAWVTRRPGNEKHCGKKVSKHGLSLGLQGHNLCHRAAAAAFKAFLS